MKTAPAALAALAIIGLLTGCGPSEPPHNPRLDVMPAEPEVVPAGDTAEALAASP